MTIVKHPVALVAVFTWLGRVVDSAFTPSIARCRPCAVTLLVGTRMLCVAPFNRLSTRAGDPAINKQHTRS